MIRSLTLYISEKAQAPGQDHGFPSVQSNPCIQSHLQNYKDTTRSHQIIGRL